MRSLILLLILGIWVGIGSLAFAQDEAPAPPPQDLGEFVDPEEGIEPEVTIIQQGSERIEEYRINGQLYMVKVVPSKGLPYYLVDSNGDGNMDMRRNDVDPDILVPRWTIFRF